MYRERPSILLALGVVAACVVAITYAAACEGCKKAYSKVKEHLNKD